MFSLFDLLIPFISGFINKDKGYGKSCGALLP